jgi:DNA polymerase III subunit epsilon
VEKVEKIIILDTETTGLDPIQGHRIIEIGCIEVLGRKKTGNIFHRYVNPERHVPDEAFRIHGLSTEFLKDKPKFAEIAVEFADFIAGSTLVIHYH